MILRSGSFFTSARLIYVAGKEGYLPAFFGQHNKRLHTPLNAMCLQASLTITFILMGGGFRRLINFGVIGAQLAYSLLLENSPSLCDSILGILLPYG